MDIGKVFGERLLKLREERNETQEQLAKAVNITRQSLSRYETNERTPNIELIYHIATHYNVSADYLLGLSEVPSIDNRVQAACEVTGLSEKAINFIIKYKNAKGSIAGHEEIYCTFGEALNSFFTSRYILDVLVDMVNINIDSEKFVKMLINSSSKRELHRGYKDVKLNFYESKEKFGSILNDMYHPLYKMADNYYSKYIGAIHGFEQNTDIIKQAEIDLQEIKQLYKKEAENNAKHNPTNE